MLRLLDLLERTTDFLAKRGVDSPRLDAELLLAEVLGLSRTQLYMNHDRPMSDPEVDAFRELVKRRGQREPVAYILGRRDFWTLTLDVTPDVLIPRPDTERLVELVLAWVGSDRSRELRIVDVGTGSGCIALALASELPAATVVAIDTSDAALEIARCNAEKNDLRERVKFVSGDLLSPLAGREAAVDVVVSNPPYVTDGEYSELDPDVREFEPRLALTSGADGLNAIRRIVPDAHRILRPGGLLAIEIGSGQGPSARSVVERRFGSARVEQDYGGHDRVVLAERNA